MSSASPPTLAHAFVSALHEDPAAMAELAAMLAPHLTCGVAEEPVGFTVATLATHTGIPVKTIRAEIREGRLRARLVGRRYVIAPAAWAEWIAPARDSSRARRAGGRPRRGAAAGPLSQALTHLDDRA